MSSQLARGGLINGATVELINEGLYDPLYPADNETYFYCYVHLLPLAPTSGVSFSSYAYGWQGHGIYIPGYPDFTPRTLWVDDEGIDDNRTPYSGSINSWGQLMNVGSSVPPTITPGLSILDGSVVEGNSGTRRLDLTVMLSGASSQQVTVQYRTSNGTAQATSDYKAASGTVTFLPGETASARNTSGEHASLSLNNVTLRHNRAVGGDGNTAGTFVNTGIGGAIGNNGINPFVPISRGSEVTLRDCTLAHNQAIGGDAPSPPRPPRGGPTSEQAPENH